MSSSSEKFIIVETNFRVFAYTQNKLYKKILEMFLKPEKEFPDMFYGKLTKDRVEGAFKQKITADQIVNFLVSHAHPSAIYTKYQAPTGVGAQQLSQMFGQMTLQNNKTNKEAESKKKANPKHESISKIFNLSSNAQMGGLQSVIQ